uniref:Protein kinase domain-containing protein n=2 Tax=Tetraselmis sp. GSL018 TaxID=582737 RepID=A0A061QWJ5_9CHLO|eukprot:CAMPEP_0177613750 /NCGR_PEP_ID=MMETSP0419_2-20121207/22205_1 /TAXON_ID=582737 /ORGANISM="Tetraselmis sp., Strain GSL018" /LENGTH=477 /DNA_ID=CAMNT_0019110595 /DNA_START=451 /DNA_END=1884 /DNA_ORIENTATION=+
MNFFNLLRFRRKISKDDTEQASESDSDDEHMGPAPPSNEPVMEGRVPESRGGEVTRRRRAFDMADEEHGQGRARSGWLEQRSDNGMFVVPTVGKPGHLLSPERFKDVAEWHKAHGWQLISGVQISTGKPILAKVYDRSALVPSKEVQIQCEQKIMAKVTPISGVLRYYNAQMDEQHICLLFAQDLRPSLKSYVSVHGGHLAEEITVRRIATPLFLVLAELHRLGVIHRDIVPDNILYSDSEPLVLTNFTNAIDTNPNTDENSGLPNFRVGTLEYMAPEVVDKPTAEEVFHEVVFKGMAEEELPMYDMKADVFSAGILLFGLVTGFLPWNPESAKDLQTMHRSSDVQELVDASCQAVSSSGRDFIKMCLTLDPVKRPSASVLLDHPWLRQHLGPAREEFLRFRSPSRDSDRTNFKEREQGRRSLSMPHMKVLHDSPMPKTNSFLDPPNMVHEISEPSSVTKYSECPVEKRVLEHNSFL